MKRSIYFFACILCTCVPSFAQHFSISGFVKDSTGIPVELASVVLLALPDSAEVSSALSDSAGYYEWKDVAPGNYVLITWLIGYEKYVSNKLVLDQSLTHDIVLTSAYTSQATITVTGSKQLVRQEADKMVVSVENMLGTSGLSALDVLKRSPGISVDKDGGITLRGKAGVLVMLDDKPLYMSAEQAGNLLKAIPSDQIKEIEIITSPSAKYDAAGNAGIINIRLKQGAYEGFNGSFNGSYGQGVYHKITGGVNASYNKNKISLSGGYQYSNKPDLEDDDIDRRYLNASSEFSRLYSYTYYRSPRENHTFTFNSRYKFTERFNASLDFIGSYGEYGWDGTGYSALYKKNGKVNNSYNTTDYGAYLETNYNTNLGFQYRPDTLGTLMSGAFNYNRYTGISNKKFEIQNFDSLGANDQEPFLYIFRDPSYTDQYSAKLDLNKTLLKKVKMEAGVKVLLNDKSNPAVITITQHNVTSDASNPFNYRDGIYAAYTSFHTDWGKKWNVQAGLRMEHTEIHGVQTALDTSFTRHYTNLFPSGNVTYNWSEKTSYTLLYSRRIQRPTPWQLNPVLAITDPYTSWGGNPYLQPEYTDNIELSQSIFSGALVTTFNYSYTQQPIAWAVVNDTATLQTVTQPRNLELRENMGLSITLNTKVTKWWTTSFYALAYRNRYVGDLGYGDEEQLQLTWNANCTQTFTIDRKTTAEVSGFYNAPTLYGLRTVASRGQFNVSLQRKIMASKATVKITYNDIFWTNYWVTRFTADDIATETQGKWDNRVLMFSFTYKFGNIVHRF